MLYQIQNKPQALAIHPVREVLSLSLIPESNLEITCSR